MKLSIVAISGILKGKSWPLGTKPLTFGRAAYCDIALNGDLVSRHHCTLRHKDGEIYLEGREARNPVLVNGKPQREGKIGIGDVLAIGSDQFLITRPMAGAYENGPGVSGGETLSLGELLAPCGPNTPIDLSPGIRVSTAEQLAFIFDTTNLLAQCTSRADALNRLSLCLKETLSPDAMWLARVRLPSGPICFQPLPGFEAVPASPPSTKIVKLVMKENTSTCTGRVHGVPGEETIVSSIVSPLAVGRFSHGAIILQRFGNSPAYGDADAVFLESVSRATTPVLQTVGAIGELRRDNARLRKQAGEAKSLLGHSDSMARLKSSLEQAARSSLNVLIQGETGTGKELAARMLHDSSSRSDGPFVVVNCAAIPEELFESQVFGYRKGAFTGAFESFEGLLAQADGGTLFLDEIADLSLPNQARILRAAENGTYRPVGGAAELAVDVCLVAATNKNLIELIKEKAFREDLYHRLSGFEICCPPLREHPEDIPELVEYFLGEATEQIQSLIDGIAPDAMADLARRAWRGNVRELRASVFRAVAAAGGNVLEAHDFRHSQFSAAAEPQDLLDLESMERRHIVQVLEKCGGNVREAAMLLGVGRSTLYKKMAQFGISN